MPRERHRATIVLAPGGPGLGTDTLSSLPLPHDCEFLSAVSSCGRGDDPIALQTAKLVELISGAPPGHPVVLIGHSAGAWAAIRAASQTSAAKNLAAVVLIAAQLANRIDRPELLKKRLRALSQPMRQYAGFAQSLSSATLPRKRSLLLDVLIADLSLTFPVRGPAHCSFLEACRRSWNVEAVRSFLERPGNFELPHLVQQVQAPILVINGQEDPWAGAPSAMEIGATAGNCIVEIVPGAGHVPWLDEPRKVGELLAKTIERATSR